jgi:[citrate (pro-3S)-lyase] ligase
MSDYSVSKVSSDDKRSNQLIDQLLLGEGIRRDKNLDYTCAMFDEDFNVVATGSCYGNTLRCLAVSSNHQGEGLMNQVMSHRGAVFSEQLSHFSVYKIFCLQILL